MLSKKAIEEYKKIYYKEFGEKLTDQQAESEGMKLLEFFKLLLEKPSGKK